MLDHQQALRTGARPRCGATLDGVMRRLLPTLVSRSRKALDGDM
jgi:hypothetical protein